MEKLPPLSTLLLAFVPYLYVVSVAYYWGYWSAFDLDAFNYYGVSDLVKGVTAPLKQPLFIRVAGLTVVFALVLLTVWLDTLRPKMKWPLVALQMLLGSGYLGYVTLREVPTVEALENKAFGGPMIYFLPGVAIVASYFIN